jgi:hypothetical protein
MPDLQSSRHPVPARPDFLFATGVIGLLGIVSLAVGQVVGEMMVPGYDWKAQTISDLAAGQNEIVMDVALYGFAAALTAAALGAAHLHLGRIEWTLGTFMLVVLAAIVVMVGARNEYGDNDNEGVVIHIYLVYALGALFAALPFLMMRGARLVGDWYAKVMKVCGGLWIVGAPLFFIVPTEWDGLWERLLGIVACALLATLSILFIQVARGAGAASIVHTAPPESEPSSQPRG